MEVYLLLKIISILSGIQAIRIIMKEIFFQFIRRSALNNDLITIFQMILFTVIIFVICKKRNISLSIFPDIQSKSNKIGYFIITVIVLFFIISTPVFNAGLSYEVIIPIILSTIATPIFEELIFRGYVWNEFKHYHTNEFTVYIITTLLFAIWHLGYADSIWLKMTLMGYTTGFLFAMFMKVITGLCFGIIIGLVRYKLKNCYATMLLHSFMNIFGR
ncbi:MAG: CPBP family intramembrane metalloprotease [Bacillota bacterium]|nr:CPBP family intramembrane metalloprotease [Bacillota bacterium]